MLKHATSPKVGGFYAVCARFARDMFYSANYSITISMLFLRNSSADFFQNILGFVADRLEKDVFEQTRVLCKVKVVETLRNAV